MKENPGAVVSAFTGVLATTMPIFTEYAERKLGRGIQTIEYAVPEVVAELKAASKADFLELCYEWGAKRP